MINQDSTEGPGLSLEEAEHQIRFVMQRIALAGRNDAEFHDIEQIIARLQAGTMSPAEAVAAAEKIEHNKQEH